MKKLAFISLFCFIFMACEKSIKTPENAPAKSTKEALARLGAVNKWKISTISKNGVIKYENGVAKDSEYTDMAEWIKFDVAQNAMEVKFPNDISQFKFVIDEVNKTFSVREIGENNKLSPEELMSIKSGSVYSDSFVLETKYEKVEEVIKLIPFQ